MFSKKALNLLGQKRNLAALPLLIAVQAQAYNFYVDGFEGQIDSQISLGSSWRLENQDPEMVKDMEFGVAINGANGNDGNLNVDKGDAFSQVIKGSHDIQISYDNFGLFARGKYWHDIALEEDDNLDDSANDDLAKYSGAALMDAFVYADLEVAGKPLDLRLGKQVLNWGESTFIRDGINQTNPVDVPAFRRPGAELKEGLIPVNMAYAGIGLTDNLSSEFFYQLEYQPTVIDDCGTFMSLTDFISPGCNTVHTLVGDLSRAEDTRPDGDGQFGLAFRYFAEAIDTEFGVYAMNIHSRTPSVAALKANFNEVALYDNLAVDNGFFESTANLILTMQGSPLTYDNLVAMAAVNPALQGTLATLNQLAAVASMQMLTTNSSIGTPVEPFINPTTYFTEYVEDQTITGLSFSTNIGSVAVAGEVSHKQNVAYSINSGSLVGALLQSDAIYTYVYKQTLAAAGTEEQAVQAGRAAVEATHGEYGLEVLDTADGQAIGGYKLFDVSQLQVTATKLFDQVLGANRIALIAEAGYTYTHGFDNNSFTKFGEGRVAFDENNVAYVKDTTTQTAWGYRARIAGTYNNVFSGVNLSPVLSISHDVEGFNGQFREGEGSLGLSLSAEYLNTYTTAISYTMYDGGTSSFMNDRDFASITAAVQF